MDSALGKIKGATKHITELNKLLREQRPFSYVLETNTQTGQRATFAKKNEAVIEDLLILIADALHNLRSGLDHAYWEIVSPHAGNDRERKAIQFPFSETAARLEEAMKNRLAHRVSERFFQALLDLKPHGEAGGNQFLYHLHAVDVVDRHRLFPPIGEYKRLTSEIIQRQVPDFPSGISDGGFGQNRRDVGWRTHPSVLADMDLGDIKPPTLHMFEKQLDVPIDVVVAVGSERKLRPMVPTLHQLVDVTTNTIKIIRDAK